MGQYTCRVMMNWRVNVVRHYRVSFSSLWSRGGLWFYRSDAVHDLLARLQSLHLFQYEGLRDSTANVRLTVAEEDSKKIQKTPAQEKFCDFYFNTQLFRVTVFWRFTVTSVREDDKRNLQRRRKTSGSQIMWFAHCANLLLRFHAKAQAKRGIQVFYFGERE